MGQARSCIQGSPDWAGPYEKPTQKSIVEDKDLYSRLGELVFLGSITKDYTALEQFLAHSHTVDQAQTKSSPSLKEKIISNSELSNLVKSKSTSLKFEDILFKDTQCKSVNFSKEQKQLKPTSVKPVIAKKKCMVHGHRSAQSHNTITPQQHHHQPGCPLSSKPSNIRPDIRRPSPPPYKETKSNRIQQQSALTMHVKPIVKDPYTKVDTFSNTAMPTSSATFQTKMITSLPKGKSSSDKESDSEAVKTKDFSTATVLRNMIPLEEEKKPESVELLAALAVHTAKETIQRLEDRGETIVETFGVVLKHMEHGDWSTFCISTSRLCDDIRKVLRDNNVSSNSGDPVVAKIANHVTMALNQLTAQILQSNLVNSVEQPNLLPSFRNLGEVLHELMEFLISKELTIVVKSLENEISDHCVKEALLAIAEMTMSGPLMGKLVTQVGAVKSLFKLCKQSKCLNLRLLSMRILTTLCSNQAAVLSFEKVDGLSFLVETISLEIDQTLKNEVLALLTQVLNQTNSHDSLKQAVQQHATQLVKNLIELTEKTLSTELYLLTASSLSSLSPFNEQASQWTGSHEQEIQRLSSISWTESYV